MKKYEEIVGLMHGNDPGSATFEQHVLAMKMDATYAWTYNQLLYALHQAVFT